ncbi:MoxR family ATPase [Enterococcus faecium]|nr:MoxR family ATPase [Enterococcus faecium]
MIVALLAGGHVLFEDIPGVGKTLLVKALAKAVQGTFSRVQCTPDLLPSDILGFSVYNSQSKEFEFRPGPIFTTILLADEINRTTPRTQSALLEAMAENHATIDNNTYPLDNHFFVLATQNPIEYEGTYPLPEAQLDRFLFRLQIGYPSFDDELLLLLDKFEKVLDNLNEVLNSYEIEEIKTNVANVFVSPEVASYALQLVSATRSHAAIQLGISPRGSLSFIQAAKAYALIHGRNYVTPKDLQDLVPYVFSHRLIFYDRSLKEDEKKQIIHTLVAQIPIPVRWIEVDNGKNQRLFH